MYILLYISAFFCTLIALLSCQKSCICRPLLTSEVSYTERLGQTKNPCVYSSLSSQLIKLKLHWLFIAMFDNSLVSLLTHAQTQTQHAGQEHCLYNICPPGKVPLYLLIQTIVQKQNVVRLIWLTGHYGNISSSMWLTVLWWCHNNKCHNSSYCSNTPHPLRRGSFTIYSPHLTQINNISWVPVTNTHRQTSSLKHINWKRKIIAKLSI